MYCKTRNKIVTPAQTNWSYEEGGPIGWCPECWGWHSCSRIEYDKDIKSLNMSTAELKRRGVK